MAFYLNKDICGKNVLIGGRVVIDNDTNIKGNVVTSKSVRTGPLTASTAYVSELTADTITAKSIARPLEVPALDAATFRRNTAYDKRVTSSYGQYQITPPEHTNNGDEESLTPLGIGMYSKGLVHNNIGEPNTASYQSLLTAVTTGRPSDYDAIIVANPGVSFGKLTSPQAGQAYQNEGADSHCLSIPPAPQFSSAWRAAEAVENYWAALLRDVSFTDYGTNSNTDADGLVDAACTELNNLTDYRGPKPVTPSNIFRASFVGCQNGPWLSQFLLLPCPVGASSIDQKITTGTPGDDYLTTFNEWLHVQNGGTPNFPQTLSPTKVYVRNGRDMATWVHMDVLYQAYFHAMQCMWALGVPYNQGNPYNSSQNQAGFATFGQPHIAALMAEVCSRAIQSSWYQKWNVHRTIRPEEFGGRVHVLKSELAEYNIHPDILNSDALARVYNNNGTWLMPMAFHEGCPTHPSYGAGHATVAGACVTVLKAFYNGSTVISSPKVPSADGQSLVNYVGDPLTVEGELNKVAWNVAFGRTMGGVHWRSDSYESMLLGERVAIEILRDQKNLYNENFAGFTFNKFDGTTITI